jgi:SRSO17 transposase
VLVLDETGFLKKGDQSAGVSRQYSGTAGRIENCQVGVFLAYAGPKGHTLVDRALYLPKNWLEDRERCKKAGIPDEAEFLTKPQLARKLLERALANGLPFAWVTADEVYGGDRTLRLWMEAEAIPYVMAVRSDEPLWRGFGQQRVKSMLAELGEDDWFRVSAGDGSKGPRMYDWALFEVNPPPIAGWRRWLLVRRSLAEDGKLAYYLVCGPKEARFTKMVAVAGMRWSIEECFESAKGEVGLDQYEVRRWDAWYRHMTLAMFAHAFLAVTRAEADLAVVAKGGRETKHSNDNMLAFKRRRGLAFP